MLYYTLRILTAWLVLFYPAYQSWKSLSHRPVSDAELERWVKHWTVIGLVVAFEYTFEYFISWVPFWYEIKTLFLLFLSLPQTQGAIYLYDVQLQPFFSRNEDAIDAGIASARSNILTFVQAQLATIFKAVYGGFVSAQNQSATNAQAQGKPAPNVAVGIPTQLAANLWQGIGGMLAGSIAQANAASAGAASAPAQAPAQAPLAPVAPYQVPLPPTPAAQ